MSELDRIFENHKRNVDRLFDEFEVRARADMRVSVRKFANVLAVIATIALAVAAIGLWLSSKSP